MILEIKKYPDPVLSKKCQPLKEITQEDKKLIKDMTATMYENNGIGLSACQVGVLKMISVVDVEDGKGLRVFINPEIVEEKGEVVFEEGCLSIPNLFLKIKRAKEITVKALNEEGKEFILKADGLLAICLQQEIDHLNGILIIDRIPLIKRLKLMFFKKI
jgi:peptide deformylase